MRKYTGLFLLLASACVVQAQNLINGQAARAVIGETTFTLGNNSPSAQILGGVSGLAWANGVLFVADSNRVAAAPQNERVLMFSTTQIPEVHTDLTTGFTPPTPDCGLCGYTAINSLGQPSFTPPSGSSSFSPGTSNDPNAPQMQTPTAVATDGTYVAVADTDNNRVLIWTSIPTTMNQPANIVLGQSNFTTSTTPSTPTASSLRGPQGVWIRNGKLFVADTQNYRILIWNSIPTTNNQPADLVLGQPNFTTGTQAACNPTNLNVTAEANELCNPVSVTSDPDSTHLFVADIGFNRVLIWNSIPTSMNQPADVVVGQPDMHSAAPNFSNVLCGTSSAGSPCQADLNFPRFALSDGTRLFIADGGNDRVLIFNSIPTTNGASADEVLGQPNFTTDVVTNQTASIASTSIDNTGAVDTLPSPMSLAFDGTNLYVSDPYNRRVSVFTPGDTPITNNPIVNWASEIIRQEGVITVGGTVVSGDTLTVTIAGTNYTYTTKSGDTWDTIAAGLVNAINAGNGDPNATAIFAGVGTATIYLSSKGTNLGYDTISLSATSSNTSNETLTTSGSYLTSGTAATGAPGMLVEINGSNLSDLPSSSPAVAPMSGNLPVTLGGTQVYMDGLPSPVLSASATQVISQVPYEFSDRNSTSVYVRTVHANGPPTVTNATPIYIAPANPGLFNAPSFSGQPRPWPASGATHQSGNPNSVVSIDGTVKAGDQPAITVNGRNYTYTVVSTDTLATIVQNLVNAINKAPDPQVTASVGAAFDRVVLTAREPGSAGTGISISGSANSGASVTVTAYTSSTCCAVASGSAITPSNPAVPGELITVTSAGLGLVADTSGNTITPTTGAPYNGTQPNTAMNSVYATMGGSTAQVVSGGLAPNSYGMYQVQLIVPSGLATNSATQLYIAQNAYISNIVTLPVGPASQGGAGGLTPTIPGVTFYANPNPLPWQAGDVGSTTLSWGGMPGNSAVYSGNPSNGGTLVGQAGSSGSVSAIGVHDGTTFYLQDQTNSSPTSSAATVATLTVHVSSPITISIDSPNVGSAPLQGMINAGGWAIDQSAAISAVQVLVDGAPVGTATYGASRPDVCAVYTNAAGCPNVGWNFSLDSTRVANGSHTMQVTAYDVNGLHSTVSVPFSVVNPASGNPTSIYIDSPGAQNNSFQGIANFAGWAINSNAAISGVAVSVDGVPQGSAHYGLSRPDVCAVYPGTAGCPNVGWNFLLDTSTLPNGPHILDVSAVATNGQRATVSTNFTVANWSTANPMVINIDNPNSQSAAFSGVAAFGGWAIDNVTAIGSVMISIDGVSYGAASYGGSRPDVCTYYPGRAGCPNVGWNFALDTTQLSDGTHTLAVTGYASGGQSSTVTTTFTVANLTASNPMHVDIDVPNQQTGALSGTTFFGGWAVSDNASISSVQAFVDGVSYGNAIYGGSRPDVCTAFPNRAGCPNVGWNISVDTRLFTNGSHTLEITATSSTGQKATTSSSFTVSNSTGSGPTRVFIDQPNGQSLPLQGLAFASGWAIDDNSSIATVTVSVDGVTTGPATYGGSRPDVCNAYPGRSGCPNVGWTFLLDTTQIPDGTHTLGILATATDGSHSTANVTFTVGNWSTPDPITIAIDTPNAQSSGFFDSVVFGGWVIDKNGPIATVKVAVDGVPFGTAVYGVSRPDVCAANPGSPGCPNVGWDIGLDTTLLSNGVHTLAVTATTPNGQSATATASFTVTN